MVATNQYNPFKTSAPDLEVDMVLHKELSFDDAGDAWLILQLASNWIRYPFAAKLHGNCEKVVVSIRTVANEEENPALDTDELPLIWKKEVISKLFDVEKCGGDRSSSFGFCAIKLPFTPSRIVIE